MLEHTNLAEKNFFICSAETLDLSKPTVRLSNGDLSPQAETRGTSGGGGIWTNDLFVDSTDFLGSLDSPFSAVVLTFTHDSISQNL